MKEIEVELQPNTLIRRITQLSPSLIYTKWINHLKSTINTQKW